MLKSARPTPLLWAAALVGLAMFSPSAAQAVGRALGPDPHDVWEGNMDYTATAGTLLQCGPGSCELNQGGNCRGLDSGTATLDNVPDLPDLHVVYAQVTWVASLPQGQAPDQQVTLTAPGGQPFPVQADPARSEQFDDADGADECQTVGLLCGGGEIACAFTFASETADITDALNAHLMNVGPLNGPWNIAGVTVPGSDDADPQTALEAIGSLTIGGWSLMVVYESPSLPLRRLYYYQGFELLAGEVRRLHPRGFLAPATPAVDVTIFALEGDAATVGDSLTINDTDVEDACNPHDNVFNETVHSGRMDGRCETAVRGVDLDAYHLEDALAPGDENADVTITLPAGNGLTTAGEQIFTNWLMIAFNHQLPNFQTLKPEKSATPPNHATVQPGDRIAYAIAVQNNGGDFATHVLVHDAPPPGTHYVAGSTIVDQSPVADDPGAVTALAGGLDLGRLVGHDRIAPAERHLVRFDVTVDVDTPIGAVITNIASISADGIDDVMTDPVQHAVGVAPDGGFPVPDMAVPDAFVAPPGDAAIVVPVPDAAASGPPPEAGICGPGEIANAAGRCVPDVGDAALEKDACAFGQASGPCASGTSFVDGHCVAICGEGTHWDETCDNGCGACKPDGVASCADAEKKGAASSGCGIGGAGTRTQVPGLLIALSGLALAGARRRRR